MNKEHTMTSFALCRAFAIVANTSTQDRAGLILKAINLNKLEANLVLKNLPLPLSVNENSIFTSCCMGNYHFYTDNRSDMGQRLKL